MKRWVERSALVVLGAVVGLLICEGIVRVLGFNVPYLTRGRLHSYDADAGWKCSPNLDARYSNPGSFDVRVRCNSRGLRDSEKTVPKPPGSRRIVVLGDSFAWGLGVENEEMFSSVLQELTPGSETVNLGVSGYSTVQELVRLETEGLRYEPDLVLLVFCCNDLTDNFDERKGGRPVAVVTEDDVLQIANRPVRRPWKSPMRHWFRQRSRLIAFVEYGTETFKNKLREARRKDALTAEPRVAGAASPAKADGRDAMRFSASDLYIPPTPEMNLAWKAMRLLLAEIKKLATKDGGSLAVVYVCTLEAVDSKMFEREIKKARPDLEPAVIDWNRPSGRLGQLCADLDISYMDLSPAFRRHPEPRLLFNSKGHWSAEGHRLAAETVAGRIETLERRLDG